MTAAVGEAENVTGSRCRNSDMVCPAAACSPVVESSSARFKPAAMAALSFGSIPAVRSTTGRRASGGMRAIAGNSTPAGPSFSEGAAASRTETAQTSASAANTLRRIVDGENGNRRRRSDLMNLNRRDGDERRLPERRGRGRPPALRAGADSCMVTAAAQIGAPGKAVLPPPSGIIGSPAGRPKADFRRARESPAGRCCKFLFPKALRLSVG